MNGSQSQNANSTIEYNFLKALDSLSRDKIDVLEGGIEKAKQKFSLIMSQVQNFLNLRTIVSAGPFLYAIIQDGTPDCKAFGNVNCLTLLAHATLRAHVTVTGGKKVQDLPLIISAPLDSDKGIQKFKGFFVLIATPNKIPINFHFVMCSPLTNLEFKMYLSCSFPIVLIPLGV